MEEISIKNRLELMNVLPSEACGEVFTRADVANNVLKLLKANPGVFSNPNYRFLDIYTKSGVFLLLIYSELMQGLVEVIPDPEIRSQHILGKMIYGISPSVETALISRKTLYGDWSIQGNIKVITGYKNDTGKRTFSNTSKEFNSMKFDVVIGNPPYNNDMYLDFVTLAHQLSSKYTCMITPAKWQAKGGEKNEAFRKNIVPRMSDIVYYPNSQDVFDIDCQGGVCYFIIKRDKQTRRSLITYCKDQPNFNTDGQEDIADESLYIMYNSKVRDIVHKLGNFNQLKCQNKCAVGKYNVAITNVYSEKSCTAKSGTAYVTISPYITRSTVKKNADTSFLESFDTAEEAKSYISYLETRFIRFMFLLAKTSLHMQSEFSWRFVPDPGKFDHIFTDKELYDKYNLTPEEIAIIESVIKERKQTEDK